MNPKRHKVVFRLGGAISSLIVVLVALPLWFPWLLKPLAGKSGLSYSRYVREGYSRFRLESVVYSNAQVRITVGRLELFVPTIWAWHLLRADTTVTYAFADEWIVRASPSTNPPGTDAGSTYTNAQNVARLLGRIDRWIPHAVTTNGTVQTLDRPIAINELRWQHGSFYARVHPPGIPSPVSMEGTVDAKQPWRLKANYPAMDLAAEIQALQSKSNLLVHGALFFQTNRIELTADFARGETLPERASLVSPSFSLPGRVVRLDGFSDIKGTLSVFWNQRTFSAEVAANSVPKNDSQLPPTDVVLMAHGDLNQVNIDQFRIAVPGFDARLSDPVSFPLARGARPAALTITGDLSRQPWIALDGQVVGQLFLSPGTNIVPEAAFSLAATNLGWKGIRARSLLLAGNLVWPDLELRDVRADFPSNAVANLTTTLDLSRREFRGGKLRFSGPVPPAWMPSGYRVDDVTLAGNFDGPIADLRHNEQLDFRRLSSPQLPVLNGTVIARGQGRDLEANLDVSTGRSHVRLSGSARSTGRTNDILINNLSITSATRPLLDLEAPVPIQLVLSSNSPTARSPWQLSFPRLTMRGPERELSLEADLAWPEEGKSSGQVHGIALRDFDEFLPTKWHPIRVDDLQFKTEWQRGPARLTAHAIASYTEGPGFTARCDLVGSASGLTISNLTVSSQLSPVLSAQGFLPVILNPASATNLVAWAQGQPIDFRADMQPDPQLWERLSQFTGIEVIRPALAINVSGPFNSPTGSVRGSAMKLNLHQKKRPLPGIEDLRLDLQFEAGKLRLNQFQFLVEKQPVSITAELPLDAQLYGSVVQRKMPDLERASARISFQHASIAALTRYLPKTLMPLGLIDVDAAIKPGLQFAGRILVTGATTEPLGPFGAIRDINAQFSLRGRSVKLDQLNATVGGQPIHASGAAELSGVDWLQGELPPFSFKLNGQNLPLVREPQVIIRADLDVGIAHTKTNQPVLTGLVRLRNSFYTRDLESLFSGSITQPSERPPWFSIETEPLANWRLDCRIKGDQFLKVRTPFLRGTISADFKLEGTLKEPMVTGQATASSGAIDFPFGSLDLRQAVLSLTAANPYQPGLYATARARRFGYDITMEVTGSADKPILQFSSVPSLNSDQILLLLTAGQFPRDEFSMTPQQKAERFAIFLGQRLLSKFGFAETSDRLTIRSGEDISESGRATYDVEFKLDRNWSIVGQYDRFNAFNLSLKRRLYSR